VSLEHASLQDLADTRQVQWECPTVSPAFRRYTVPQ
jgi:hypothetical protein